MNYILQPLLPLPWFVWVLFFTDGICCVFWWVCVRNRSRVNLIQMKMTREECVCVCVCV